MLLSSGWHDHHEEESAEEHRAHIVGEAAHEGLHVDSLPAHHAEHHAPDCLTCAFVTQVSLVDDGGVPQGVEPIDTGDGVTNRPAARLRSLPSRVRGPPATV